MKTIQIFNCMDCPHHMVVNDPDPTDSFCSDDLAVPCTKSPNIRQQTPFGSTEEWDNRPVTFSCRPHHLRDECNIPSWCPLE